MMKREEIKAVYDQGPEAVISLVERLFSIIEKQQEQIAAQQQQINKLTARVAELEDRLAKNSQNSSKPPSSDQRRQIKSLRKSKGNKSGGQTGHQGNTLFRIENPDHIIVHKIEKCCDCGFDLQLSAASQYECRQVFDLPEIKMAVTEHQVEVKECPQCGQTNKGSFPPAVSNVVQYGAGIKGLIVYLMNYQLLPYRRTSELIAQLCGQTISEGTLQQTLAECGDNLSDSCEQIKAAIRQATVANFDESGLYVAGKRLWLHVSATKALTYYQYHEKRGSQALDAIDILPNFTGTAVHDGYGCYQDYQCQHALCNAHHLRELTFLSEQYDLAWPAKMIDHLLKIKQAVDDARQAGKTALDKIELDKFQRRYHTILREGFAADIPPELSEQPRRGRIKQSKAKNLLDRLSNNCQAVLAFMYDFNVPFDNNQAERDIRMIKVQQKISGCFRSIDGATIFCKIRSYISSIRKQGLNVLAALKSVFAADPIQPLFQPE